MVGEEEDLNASLARAEDFIYALRNAGSKYSLDRMVSMAEALGSPHLRYPVVHVAGTNGKGSVCAMLEAIIRASGAKVGMFTSPHLVYLGERVQINRNPIPKPELASEIWNLKNLADKKFGNIEGGKYPSFFEFMTLVAFEYFAEKNVDAAVVEVGLGGRIDSTNIVLPDVSVITSIGLDHTALLGNTLEMIAREKAGIIKESVPIVCGFIPDGAMKVIEAVAKERGSKLYKASEYFPADDSIPFTNLSGMYQRRNAATALLAARVLMKGKSPVFLKISEASARAALGNVSWAARWEERKLPNGARIILDSSHNEEGARALEENLSALASKGIRPTIALGVLGKERAVPILSVAAKYAKELVFLVPSQPRALSHAELRECMPQMSHNVKIYNSCVEEFYRCGGYEKFVSPTDTLVSTGSIYLAGEVIAALDRMVPDMLQDRP